VPSKRFASPQQGLAVFAKNKMRVSAFYQQSIDLAIEASDVSHDLPHGHGYEIVVHAIRRKCATGIKIAKPPEPRDDAAFKPTFVVWDLSAARAAAVNASLVAA
jgi:hypothetical protein